MLSVKYLNRILVARPLTTICRSFASAKDDLDSFLEVESAMFDDTGRSEKPIRNSDQLLREYRIKSDMKQFKGKKTDRPARSRPQTRSQSNYTEPMNIVKMVKEPSVEINDTELGLKYTKLGFNDALMHNILTTIRSRKSRNKNNQIIVEGRRLIVEAIDSGLQLQTLIFSQKDQLSLIREHILPLKEVTLYKAPHHDLKTWSTLTTSPGLMAVFDRPDGRLASIAKSADTQPITVICDNIREPNNLGSIIRSCAAIPCEQVIIVKGCCDPWETKALRGGCGGQFRIQIQDDVHWENVDKLLPENCSVFLAESNLERVKAGNPTGKIAEYSQVQVSADHNVVVIGGETHGISAEAYSFLNNSSNKGTFLHIPLAKGVESLNAASALTLILFEIRKHLTNPKKDRD